MKRFLILALVLVTCVPVLAGDAEADVPYWRTEAFVQLVIGLVAAVLYQVRQHVDKKKQEVIDMVTGIANGVEKGIPDDTDSPGLKKIDKGLRRFGKAWAAQKGRAPAAWLVACAKAAFEAWVARNNAGRKR